jgi:hypothetical protein
MAGHPLRNEAFLAAGLPAELFLNFGLKPKFRIYNDRNLLGNWGFSVQPDRSSFGIVIA